MGNLKSIFMKHLFTFLLLIVSLTISAQKTWNTITLEASTSRVRSMCVFNNNEAFVCGYDSLLYRTTNGGASWEKQNMSEFYPSGSNGWDFSDASSYGNSAIIGVADEKIDGIYYSGFILKTTDKANTWNVIAIDAFDNSSSEPADNPALSGTSKHHFYSVEMVNENTMFTHMRWENAGNDYNAIFKSTNGGSSWIKCNTPTIEGVVDGDLTFMGEIGYFAGGANCYLLKTIDGGENWTNYNELDVRNYEYINGLMLLGPHEVLVHTWYDIYYSTTEDFSNQTAISLDGTKTKSYDFYAYDNNSIINLYKQNQTHVINDLEGSWEMAGDGVSTDLMYYRGEIYNDSLYVLGKAKIYSIYAGEIFNPYTSTNIYDEILTNSGVKVSVSFGSINIQSDINIKTVEIYNLSGNKVYSNEFNQTYITIPTDRFTKGIYIIRCDNQTFKIVI